MTSIECHTGAHNRCHSCDCDCDCHWPALELCQHCGKAGTMRDREGYSGDVETEAVIWQAWRQCSNCGAIED